MTKEIITTLNKKDATDALLDLGEVAIDSFITSDAIKDIPIIGTLIKLKNFGVSISDFYFLKKLQKFVFELEKISDEDKDKFFKKINSDAELQSKVNDNLFLLINATDDIQKPEYLGKVFSQYINGRLTYEKFMQFSTTVNNLNIHQIKLLGEMSETKTPNEVGHSMAGHGLVNIGISMYPGTSVPEYHLNENGILFINILFDSELKSP